MPPTPQPPAPAPHDAPEAYDLSTPEEVRSRKRRRQFGVALLTLPALLIGGWFGGRPAVHAVKGWQAQRIAAQAEVLIDAGAWREAQGKVQDGRLLRPMEPAVLRAAARFLTRVGQSREALNFWMHLEGERPLTAAEQRDVARAQLDLGDLTAAVARLRQARAAGGADTPDDWVLAMRLAAGRRLNGEALDLARKLAASPAASERQRLEGAVTLLNSGAAEDQADGWNAVQKLADGGKSAESLEATVILGRQSGAALAAGAAKSPPAKPFSSPGDLAARLEAHPLARVQHRLLALDLQLAQDASKRAEIIATAIHRFANGESEDLAGLGGWLYAKGELARVLEVIPESKAVLSRPLYLQYLDTLGGLGRWADIEDLIQRQRFTLDPMVEQMYLARCSEQLNKKEGRDVHWKAALAAAGTSFEKLLTLGHYAARNGALDPAEAAYTAALAIDPASRPACAALLELYQRQGRTVSLHELLARMAARWPEDDAVRNDAAYTGLLLGLDLNAARDTARDLVRKAPGSLPHRVTLALAELRLGHALTGLEAFAGMDVPALAGQPRHLAVYAALRWETSSEEDARRLAAGIPPDRLLPEERALLARITP